MTGQHRQHVDIDHNTDMYPSQRWASMTPSNPACVTLEDQ
jgi:hypothetical protein